MAESHLFSDDDGPLTCGHAGQLGEEQQGSEAAMDEEEGEEEAATHEEEGRSRQQKRTKPRHGCSTPPP